MNILKLILLFLSPLLLSQQQIVEYKLYKLANYKEDTPSYLKDIFKADNDTILLNLITDKNRATFVEIEKIDNSQNPKIDLTKSFIRSKGTYYFDLRNQMVENKKNIFGKDYIIEYHYDDIKWEITNETRFISGYHCRKALNKLNDKGVDQDLTTTVWFTDEVNTDSAPFGLTGLKGLIIKINFNQRYEVVFNSIYETFNKNIEPPKKGKRISLSEYNKMIYDYLIQIRESRRKNDVDISE